MLLFYHMLENLHGEDWGQGRNFWAQALANLVVTLFLAYIQLFFYRHAGARPRGWRPIAAPPRSHALVMREIDLPGVI